MQLPGLISLAIILATVFVSLLADRRFAGVARLPMQWGLNGRPTWTAPRGFALAFIPALSVAVFCCQQAIQGVTARPGPGFEPIVLTGTFFVINIVYVFLLRRAV
jgi:hypothetical protein